MPPAAKSAVCAFCLLCFASAGRAALIPRPDLTQSCSLSTDIVEARLTRKHLPGKPEWADTFSVTVLITLAGSCKTGDHLSLADTLSLYEPAQTGQRVLLFLKRRSSLPRLEVVDMRLIDTHSRVRRYFQPSNPGGLLAEGFRMAETGQRPGPPGQYTAIMTATEDDTKETKYPTLTELHQAVAAQWAAKQRSH